MGSRDLYSLLGVSKDATDVELKKGYRKQAVKWHPDRHSSATDDKKKAAEERFKDIAYAYENLSDPNKRAAYDRYGEDGLKFGGAPPAAATAGGGGVPFGAPGATPGGGVHFSFGGAPAGGGASMSREQAEQIFSAFFGGSSPFASMGSGGMGGLGGMVDLGGGGMGGMGGFGGFGGTRSFSGQPENFGQKRHQSHTRSSADRVKILPPGTIVRLVGLASEAHRNTVGEVQDFDDLKERYTVRLLGRDTVSVKAENLRQVILKKAKIIGTTRSSLNNRMAASAEFDSEMRRYRVEGVSPDGGTLALKPENVILPPSTRVRVSGLKSRPALNGKTGVIVGVDDDRSPSPPRYTVQLEDSEQLRVTFGAVQAC